MNIVVVLDKIAFRVYLLFFNKREYDQAFGIVAIRFAKLGKKCRKEY